MRPKTKVLRFCKTFSSTNRGAWIPDCDHWGGPRRALAWKQFKY